MKVETIKEGRWKKIVVTCDCGRAVVIPIIEPPPDMGDLFDKKENYEFQDRRGEAKRD